MILTKIIITLSLVFGVVNYSTPTYARAYVNCEIVAKESPISELDCLLRHRMDDLSDWDKFRKQMLILAIELRQDYCIPMTEDGLYDSLMKTVHAECKFKVGRGAINRLSDARGSIQWTRRSRRKLNVPNDIHNYKLHDQVPHIKTYFKYKIRLHKINTDNLTDVIDIYCIVFAPAKADSPRWKTVYSKGNRKKPRSSYEMNKGYDLNGDGKITKSEIRARILRHYK